MKVGIVVPFSWSFWGAVLEHAELQAEALRARGLDVRIIIGNDPPGTFTRALHPRHGRHDEPPTPAICVSALAVARCALVATWHAAGGLGWMRIGLPSWGFLLDRIDHYIAVSEQARVSAQRWVPYDFEVIPNGVLIPPEAEPGNRDNSVVFIGRHDPRKGMP